MDPLVLSTLPGLVAWGVTATFVLSKNPRHPLNRSFFALGMAGCVWGIGLLLRYTARSGIGAHVFYGMAIGGACAALILFFHFVQVFLRAVLDPPLPSWLSWGVQGLITVTGVLAFAAVAFTPYGAEAFFQHDGRYYVKTGPAFGLLVIWGLAVVVLSLGPMVILSGRIRENRHRSQAYIVIVATLVPGVLIALLELIFSATSRIAFVGEPFLATTVFGLVIGYGVVRYGLMSVNPESAARQIVATLPDGLVLMDRQGIIISANPAFLKLVGKTEDDVIGHSVFDLIYVEEEDNPRSTRLKFSSGIRNDYKLNLAGPPGEEPVPVSTTITPILDPDQERVGNIMVFRDIRPLEKLQTELVRAEKLAGLGELVAGVAHEINNPLTTVMGLSELGAMRYGSEAPGEFFQKIFDQAVRSREIVKNLLLFAHQGSGKPGTHAVPTRLHEVLSEVVELARIGMKEGEVEIRTAFHASDITAVFDSEQMRQVFHNLIRNAYQALIKYSGAGRITITTSVDGDWALIDIEDDGPGIPEKVLPRIFDPFFTTKGIGKGTGLGLSICHGILESHKGGISVESTVDEGTRFTVELPLARATMGPDGASAKPV